MVFNPRSVFAASGYPELDFHFTRLKFPPMEEITLSFDISEKRLGFEDSGILRGEISDLLDKALKDAGAGRWTGATSNLARMEIFLKVTDSDQAVDIINSALADHWIFPLMEIRNKEEIH